MNVGTQVFVFLSTLRLVFCFDFLGERLFLMHTYKNTNKSNLNTCRKSESSGKNNNAFREPVRDNCYTQVLTKPVFIIITWDTKKGSSQAA